jgi:hypothetical protein
MTSEQNKPDTYLCLQNENGSFEADLVTFREKGQQVRYLAFTFTNLNQKTNIQEQSTLSLDEQSFLKLKDFFRQLEWNS